ncbi:HupE/UreJ family protein [Halomonas elongata]|uniref:HupE/UreJ family protein n=3 Tax=Halomonas elongata TaxID=2746 RepID=E1VBA6_HALED|nr:HupE/UreJ family protein [Halomonas elongata]OBX36783.1 HupE / UreJ protein [Halomonas elongata]WBF19436.1 HupE/UreJ family protein [Halomonas elongata]WPU48297.1 HupE/UreJ family protein [Halomonas elongata DSM 2581]CBV42167.1 urease accessory protein UreJ [Halomonas elongata DSM 2581]
MPSVPYFRFWLAAPILLLVSGMAMAHPGHGAEQGGFMAGLAHPLFGLDHLLAMAAIGLWSLGQSRRLRMAVPLLAVGGMIIGAGLAVAGIGLPGVESAIALSVLLAGVLVATLAKLPSLVGGLLVVGFMLFHGHAHGTEMPHGASLVTYLAGFSLATLAITLGARLAGGWLQARQSRSLRVVGGVIAAIGAFFALS